MADMTVANAILEQLGGRRFQVMTGSNNFMGDKDSLSFRVPAKKANYVKITLMPNDTYKMEFKKIWGMKVKDIKSFEDVYCDQLQELFTEVTEMYTSL